MSAFLATGRHVDTEDSLEVRCGRCGVQVRIPFSKLLELRTFDCAQCQRITQADEGPQTPASNSDEIARRCTEALSTLNDEELAIIVRTAVGFSQSDITEMYDVTASDIGALLKRLLERLTWV
jgi:DNA-directed RNA polymerase specialized sigma24 family protein